MKIAIMNNIAKMSLFFKK